jgi:uncharacterized protein YndB with AHSA1/START domain
MPPNRNPLGQTPERELTITRVFDAPREVVFKAWTEPERFARWWGPKGWTTPFCTIDPRPGGRIHFCMRSPEGVEIWNGGVYREVDPPARLVCTDYFADEAGNPVPPTHYGMSPDFPAEALVTVTFEDVGGRTRLTFRQSIPVSLATRVGAQQGWNETFDRLVEYLATD